MDSATSGESREAGHAGLLAGIHRAELFAGLCILGFANGIARRVHDAIMHDGAAAALFAAFDISAVVWVAFYACPMMLLRAPRAPLARTDLLVAACALAAFVLPVDPLSWIALTGIALYILCGTSAPRGGEPPPFEHRGAWILLATTGAVFWGRALLAVASGPILDADALLISWLTGTEHLGNTVRFADGAGYVWIAPACSSLANISLAVLCWVLFAQFRGLGWSFGNAGWCLLACLSVVAINVARIGLMVLHREHFDLIHGLTGAAVASWLSIGAAVGICAYGTRHGRLAHA